RRSHHATACRKSETQERQREQGVSAPATLLGAATRPGYPKPDSPAFCLSGNLSGYSRYCLQTVSELDFCSEKEPLLFFLRGGGNAGQGKNKGLRGSILGG